MSIELQYALVLASVLAIFWWVYHLAIKSPSPRSKAIVAKAPRQPWGDDKNGGRGNR